MSKAAVADPVSGLPPDPRQRKRPADQGRALSELQDVVGESTPPRFFRGWDGSPELELSVVGCYAAPHAVGIRSEMRALMVADDITDPRLRNIWCAITDSDAEVLLPDEHVVAYRAGVSLAEMYDLTASSAPATGPWLAERLHLVGVRRRAAAEVAGVVELIGRADSPDAVIGLLRAAYERAARTVHGELPQAVSR